MNQIIRLTALIASFILSVKASAHAKANADAIAIAESLPWARANSHAASAAKSYAQAYAHALSMGYPDPEAYALAQSEDQCATIACHASCGLMIIEGQRCSLNTENSFWGPHNSTCLCAPDSPFLEYYPPCMECGWTLWKYYSAYVIEALQACETLSTEPTGTSRCSTTLTDIYTPDWEIDACLYTGGCETTTTNAADTDTLPDTLYTEETALTEGEEEIEDTQTSSELDSTEDSRGTITETTGETTGETTTPEDTGTPDITTLAEPIFTGELLSGNVPEWSISVPGTLGPWSNIDIKITKNDMNNMFEYSHASVFVNGIEEPSATIAITPDSIAISLDRIIDEDGDFVVNFRGIVDKGNFWTSNARITITTFDDEGLREKAEVVYELSSTISSNIPGKEESITSKSTLSDVATTIITTKSCDDDEICYEFLVITGVTVVVTTLEGLATSYTTYCPIESDTEIKPTQDDNVTIITTCETHICYEVTATSVEIASTKPHEVKETLHVGTSDSLDAEGEEEYVYENGEYEICEPDDEDDSVGDDTEGDDTDSPSVMDSVIRTGTSTVAIVDVTADTTADITADITADVTADVTTDVTADVIADTTDVTADVTADTTDDTADDTTDVYTGGETVVAVQRPEDQLGHKTIVSEQQTLASTEQPLVNEQETSRGPDTSSEVHATEAVSTDVVLTVFDGGATNLASLALTSFLMGILLF